MKKNIKFISLSTLFRSYVQQEARVSLNNSIELLVLGKRIGWRILHACFPSQVKTHKRLVQLHNFFKYLLIMRKRHGSVFVVGYLKAGQLAIQKAISKDKISSMRDLDPNLPFPRLSTSGLPRYIPLGDRRLIGAGSPSVIRWWLTLFSVYRIISIPGKLKLGTITDPLSVPQKQLDDVSYELGTIVLRLKKLLPKIASSGAEMRFLESSSPSAAASWVGMIGDVQLLQLSKYQHLKESLLYFFKYFNLSLTNQLFETISDFLVDRPDYSYDPGKETFGNLGQLSIKSEAAGKERVFALVDIWTQSALRPLHDYLFSVLRSLPNDGTFDQYAAVKRCFTKADLAGKSFGYDLTAATDRLPIQLQVEVLTQLFNQELAQRWKTLLVDRDYLLRTGIPVEGTDKTEWLRYAVGQPMGALSSWAMLALTHHFLVQLSSQRVKVTTFHEWFDNYELLGDDIVIFNEEVAMSYLKVMEELGVPINLSKSVVARNGSFEFAKITGFLGKDVSALSWQMFISQNTLLGRVNIIYSLLKKNIHSSHPIKWMRGILSKTRFNHGDLRYPYLALLNMLANVGSIQVDVLLKSLVKSEDLRSYSKLLKSMDVSFMEHLLASLTRNIRPNWVNNFKVAARWYGYNQKIVTYITDLRLERTSRLNLEMQAKKQTFFMLDLLGIKVDPWDYQTINLSGLQSWLDPARKSSYSSVERLYAILSLLCYEKWHKLDEELRTIDSAMGWLGGFASLGGSVDYTNSIPMYLMTDPIIGVRPSMPEASLDKNLQILELVDQVKTDVELAKRSASKISHDAKAVMIKKDSPVKVLSLFVKALKQKKTPVLKG